MFVMWGAQDEESDTWMPTIILPLSSWISESPFLDENEIPLRARMMRKVHVQVCFGVVNHDRYLAL